MKRQDIQELVELAWRRPLTESELARIREWMESGATPAERHAVSEELQTAMALSSMPGVEVSSNFMSQVWGRIEAEERQVERSRRGAGGWRYVLPRWAAAAAVLILVAGTWVHQKASNQRLQTVELVLSSPAAPQVTDLVMFQEFEAIQAMSQASPNVDIELLGALQ